MEVLGMGVLGTEPTEGLLTGWATGDWGFMVK